MMRISTAWVHTWTIQIL
jgi:hypothetical protein